LKFSAFSRSEQPILPYLAAEIRGERRCATNRRAYVLATVWRFAGERMAAIWQVGLIHTIRKPI
jgi:hypothetical protein